MILLHKGIVTVNLKKEGVMAESYYKIVELIGASDVSWEAAARGVVEEAAKSLKDLRIGEVTKLDMKMENGKVAMFRARVSVSFKYHS